jgi:hypothetical protein
MVWNTKIDLRRASPPPPPVLPANEIGHLVALERHANISGILVARVSIKKSRIYNLVTMTDKRRQKCYALQKFPNLLLYGKITNMTPLHCHWCIVNGDQTN